MVEQSAAIIEGSIRNPIIDIIWARSKLYLIINIIVIRWAVGTVGTVGTVGKHANRRRELLAMYRTDCYNEGHWVWL